MEIYNGNCLDEMKRLADNSVSAIVTDPPYGLSFMNKHWDYDVPSIEIWKEALRVLKPGGHLLSFGGTRTYHRMVVAIEDAGFEIRDQIQWIYGSGFPKSHNIDKAIDKMAGAEREVIGEKTFSDGSKARKTQNLGTAVFNDPESRASNLVITAPSTDSAKQWQGWGTALKPANEPIVVARKPLDRGMTIAQNVLKYGTGALNIDETRIGTDKIESGRSGHTGFCTPAESTDNKQFSIGRWPANVIFDEEAAAMLDEQSGVLKTNSGKALGSKSGAKSIYGNDLDGPTYDNLKGDFGGASRFFYCAKASRSERNTGLEDDSKEKQGARPNSGNNHPTVKPIKLMEYLIKLVTPPNEIVLDPFMGSGSTGVAAKNLGVNFIGIEMNEEYFEIAKKRLEIE